MKRFTALISALALCLCMTACSNGNGNNTTSAAGGTVALKVWGSQDDQQVLQMMIDSFKAENPDVKYDITLGVVGEKDTQARLLEDAAAAADVFSFPDDQITDLVNAGALYEITRNKDKIESENISGAVDAATVNGALYAYPMTADNGYFMYYDKSVVSDEQAKTLDGVLEACKKENKKFFMDISNGWYVSSFFLAAGCTVGVDNNGNQTCDFDNADGIKAGEAVKALCAHPSFVTGDDAVFTGGMGDTIAAGVSGAWTAEAVMKKLGNNYAAAKLPTATIDGKQVQLKSFAGYKLVGINSSTKQPLEAMKLAEWLTNEENQLLRFEKREAGPSNTKAAQHSEVQANVALTALAAQNEFGVSQRGIKSTFWSPLEAFGTTMENKDYSKSVSELLKSMVRDITT